MRILLVAATTFEILPVQQWLTEHFERNNEGAYLSKKGPLSIDILVTGVGMTATAWHLGYRLAQTTYDWVWNAGIAGALDLSLSLGTVVQVVTDRFGDLGVEEADGTFTDMLDMGLIEPNKPPFINGALHNPYSSGGLFLQQVQGITVQRVHGYAPSIQAVRLRYPSAQVESMEGAAFAYSCLMANVSFMQIRALSNYVETRDRSKWQIPLAIDALNEVLIGFVESLDEIPTGE